MANHREWRSGQARRLSDHCVASGQRSPRRRIEYHRCTSLLGRHGCGFSFQTIRDCWPKMLQSIRFRRLSETVLCSWYFSCARFMQAACMGRSVPMVATGYLVIRIIRALTPVPDFLNAPASIGSMSAPISPSQSRKSEYLASCLKSTEAAQIAAILPPGLR